ncbi:beta-1,3-galactosyl-O-glycosyl-glycoprotein beta-1,6-N-acetylglucosaminyltransferase 7-like [Phyllostomus hastatus]|uniref:beta-1,3-galactosyl-O-glycosyl-glycoprotein beta-1,6-N-acetylglucosaminyltransferase 7-like n=1 Tax=Phyllostomus hastatus TaxID=9423 RepID=UPI001E685A8D|nr:beta-1,3-galactosyl-O-glycosyl-glycoprotein beta-1,6-N-acetylglucosaminyltransferase 7-like [Phyllostomus hastatus]
MSRLRAATRPGLLVGVAACVSALLYFRSAAPGGPGAEPPTPAVSECGFYPDELCSALLEGRGAASQVARFCKAPLGPGVPACLQAPGNCSRISRALRFVSRPLSAEEGSFPLAYVVAAHEELVPLVRLLRAVYAPQNVYCVHVDGRAPEEHRAAVRTLASCFDNVFITSPRTEPGAQPGLTRLQADLSCMEGLVHSGVQWHYVINLCGRDFPIKTNREIVRYIRSKGNGKNITPGVIQVAKTKSRTSQSQPEPTPKGRVYVPPNEGFQEEPPHNLTVYFGSAHYMLTRAFVQFVLTDSRAKDMLRWSRALQSPERHYWVTLNRLQDAPGATPGAGWEGRVRATKRRGEEGDACDGCKGRSDPDSCVYGPADLPRLVWSPSLFASRFESSTEPLAVACLERWQRQRVLQQAEVPVEPHWRFPRQSDFRGN